MKALRRPLSRFKNQIDLGGKSAAAFHAVHLLLIFSLLALGICGIRTAFNLQNLTSNFLDSDLVARNYARGLWAVRSAVADAHRECAVAVARFPNQIDEKCVRAFQPSATHWENLIRSPWGVEVGGYGAEREKSEVHFFSDLLESANGFRGFSKADTQSNTSSSPQVLLNALLQLSQKAMAVSAGIGAREAQLWLHLGEKNALLGNKLETAQTHMKIALGAGCVALAAYLGATFWFRKKIRLNRRRSHSTFRLQIATWLVWLLVPFSLIATAFCFSPLNQTSLAFFEYSQVVQEFARRFWTTGYFIRSSDRHGTLGVLFELPEEIEACFSDLDSASSQIVRENTAQTLGLNRINAQSVSSLQEQVEIGMTFESFHQTVVERLKEISRMDQEVWRELGIRNSRLARRSHENLSSLWALVISLFAAAIAVAFVWAKKARAWLAHPSES